MRNVTLVVGAPCAGKSTIVNERAQSGDIVIDWDQLAVNAGSPFSHDHPKQYRAAATAERTRLERIVAESADVSAWVIRTLPRFDERAAAAQRLGATDIVVVDPGMATCLERARFADRPPHIDGVIVKWYAIQAGARNYGGTDDRDSTRKNDPRKSAEWRRVSAIVRRPHDPCRLCGKPIRYDHKFPHPLSFSVDHIVPIDRGGAWFDLSNLQAAHLSCNSAKQARTDGVSHRTSRAW
ncbi:HNH endonuclease [Curtobacterium oceanosedimentum]|uniref:HNH endonuclease n=1 Tax=Curtobacterium oceanosedimentum TaxID=465820 RepID=UPI003391B28A